MSGSSDYTTTPNLGLFMPNYDMDDGTWGAHLNSNASVLDSAVHALQGSTAGGPFLPLTGGTVSGQLSIDPPPGIMALSISASHVQPSADYVYNQFYSEVSYNADGTNGDSLGLISYMNVKANGHNVPASASQHTCALYGNGSLNTAGTVYQVIGVMGVSGNSGSGTVTNAVDFFGHQIYNTGGGHITNHYFLFQEGSNIATNEYGAFFAAPVGIGTTNPTFNLDIEGSTGAPLSSTNMLKAGAFSVTTNGSAFYPGYNPGGTGGLGVVDLVVGNNGAQNATNATSAFMYISSCAGAPTGVPTQAALGRVAMTYDTTTHKLWLHDGTSWRGVVVT